MSKLVEYIILNPLAQEKIITMEILTTTLTFLHVAVGCISLILFWLPIFTRKGGKIHRKIGNLYVYSMWIVVITAAILSIKNVIIGDYFSAIFLGFLTLISANPLWYGMAILKHKKGVSLQFKRIHFSFNIAIILFGAFMVAYALFNLEKGASVLLLFFGILGLSSAPQVLRDYRTQLAGKSWFKEHYQGMVITGTAGYTAFFAFGGRSLMEGILTGYWQILPWILPTILTFIGLRYTRKHYERKGILNPKVKTDKKSVQLA